MNLADCVIVLENILRSAIDITPCKKSVLRKKQKTDSVAYFSRPM